MMNEEPRKTPCASCPYRRDVPSGIWSADEYERLRDYDGEIVDQVMHGATSLFGCHQADGKLCAGWFAHRDPYDLLAVRLAVGDGRMSDEVLDYETTVPLFGSGEEVCEHGKRDIDAPDERAVSAVRKLIKSNPSLEIR